MKTYTEEWHKEFDEWYVQSFGKVENDEDAIHYKWIQDFIQFLLYKAREDVIEELKNIVYEKKGVFPVSIYDVPEARVWVDFIFEKIKEKKV